MGRRITSQLQSPAFRRRSRVLLLARAFLVLVSCVSTACEIKGSDACDEHQIYETGGKVLAYGVCVCDENAGYVFDTVHGYGCKHCADGQRVVDGKCAAAASDAGAEQDAGSDASSPAPGTATGVGEACKSDADCASFDAKYCAPIVNVCRVNNCANGQNKCPTGSACCDYNLLLSGLSLCVAEDELDNGQCTMGGVKVEP